MTTREFIVSLLIGVGCAYGVGFVIIISSMG